MKYFLLIACLAFTIVSNAGGDTKVYKQVAGAIAKNDLKKAAETLEKISATGQTSTQYLQAAALIYDSLKDYNKAISYYSRLPKEAADPVAVETRIAYLKAKLAAYQEAERIRLEKQKNCTKCSGTGVLEQQVTCPLCDGQRIITKPCSRCQGTTRVNCSSCRGAGRIEISNNGRTTLVNCSGCGGKGYLMCNTCNRGALTEDCRKCNATGTVIISKPCDLH